MVAYAIRERKCFIMSKKIDLNNGQQEVMDALLAGYNVFLTGSAGTGKSVVIREFTKKAQSMGKNVVVVAPTGIAALNVDGATIHMTFNVPLHPIVNEPSKLPNDISIDNVPDTIFNSLTISKEAFTKKYSKAEGEELKAGLRFYTHNFVPHFTIIAYIIIINFN